jgi:hypothetical protein
VTQKERPLAEKRDFDEFLEKFQKHHQVMVEELHKVIVGQDDVIDQILAAIFTGGHCLLVGVPGLAKTLVVSTIAKLLDVNFRRIQFTPDLMPSDITGTNVLEESESGRREFRFVEGPVFTNILLATKSTALRRRRSRALLQAMQEHEVTVGQTTYKLPEPFFVIATQNPIEQEGTYPLPEAQQDRFMFNVNVDYPTLDEEEKILEATTSGERAGSSQGSVGKIDFVSATPDQSDRGQSIYHQLRRATCPGDATQRRRRSGIHQTSCRLGCGSPRRAESHRRSQSRRSDGWTSECFHRRRTESCDPGPAAPCLHKLSRLRPKVSTSTRLSENLSQKFRNRTSQSTKSSLNVNSIPPGGDRLVNRTHFGAENGPTWETI